MLASSGTRFLSEMQSGMKMANKDRRRRRWVTAAVVLGALGLVAVFGSLFWKLDPHMSWIIRSGFGGAEKVTLSAGELSGRLDVIWFTPRQRAVAFARGQSAKLPGEYGEQHFAIRCGDQEWPLFSYLKLNSNHYSTHQVTCRSEGVALWCDVESRGANPGRRLNISVTSDARACGLPME
jgi:hypothetical protein